MAQSLLDRIEEYWTSRVEGYSEVNHEELNGVQNANWSRLIDNEIRKIYPGRERSEISVLDVGTGPGFFPIILTRLGYQVTAVDYTQAMLDKAAENAGELADKISYRLMNAEELSFPRDTFDVVISRNLTWNLEHPDRAYTSWHSVLRPGGLLLNFDANWYNYLYDDEAREAYEQDRRNVESSGLDDHYTCTDIDTMEDIARKMPLSSIKRPLWDIKVLTGIGMQHVRVEEDMGKDVWSETEKLNYAATPMFMIAAVKESEVKEKVRGYWSRRSGSFSEAKHDEAHSYKAELWRKEINDKLSSGFGEDVSGRALRILDVGCGAGFFEMLLAPLGYKMTGIDLTPDMILQAKALSSMHGAGSAEFYVMDAERPDFPDESFDVVISRNLTWTLPHPDEAYREWYRVLRKGGVLLNFDAEYAKGFHEYDQAENCAHSSVGDDMIEECHEIYHMLDISTTDRPGWDMEILSAAGFREVEADCEAGDRLYGIKDRFYMPDRMFCIKAIK